MLCTLEKLFETAGDLVLWACHSPQKSKLFLRFDDESTRKFITKHVPLCLHETAQAENLKMYTKCCRIEDEESSSSTLHNII